MARRTDKQVMDAFMSGESIEDLAFHYNTKRDDIEAALRRRLIPIYDDGKKKRRKKLK